MTEQRPPIHPAPNDWPEVPSRDYHNEIKAERDALRAEVERLKNQLSYFGDFTSQHRDELKARAESAERKLAMAKETLTSIIDDVQLWCDAIDRDSSWDGWDDHFKSMKWDNLPAYRASLTAIDAKDGE